MQILEEFSDFKAEIDKIVAEREKKRLENLQQAKLKKDVQEEFKELNYLVDKIDFDRIN
jgi:hypothetical protein